MRFKTGDLVLFYFDDEHDPLNIGLVKNKFGHDLYEILWSNGNITVVHKNRLIKVDKKCP
jgi:hypothetical protein